MSILSPSCDMSTLAFFLCGGTGVEVADRTAHVAGEDADDNVVVDNATDVSLLTCSDKRISSS